MANLWQLARLKMGVDAWNKWRHKNFSVKINLTRANLRKVNLSAANLSFANLNGANLRAANLGGANRTKAYSLTGPHRSEADLPSGDISGAHLTGAVFNNAHRYESDLPVTNLSGANLGDANLQFADLTGANLTGAVLTGADLSNVYLYEADLTITDLSGTKLSEADLTGVHLYGTNLNGARFQEAYMSGTVFGKVDLSQALGLDQVRHGSPSTIGTDTFQMSQGRIPETFLKGCGLSDWEIEHAKLYDPDLSNEQRNKVLYKIYDLQASQAIQIFPLFISYSHADSKFVDSLGVYFDKRGIRYWRDIHKAVAGPLEEQVNRAIRQNPTVVVVLSEYSIQSDWVEHEVRIARQTGKDIGRHVLCPVALDDSWKKSPWPERVMEQIMEYNILDFSEWQDDIKFNDMFHRLIDGLELFYKG